MKHLFLFETFNSIPAEILNFSFLEDFFKEFPRGATFDEEEAPCDIVARDLMYWLKEHYPKIETKLLVGSPEKYNGLMYHAVALLNDTIVIDLSHYQINPNEKVKIYSKEEFLKMFPQISEENDDFYKEFISEWSKDWKQGQFLNR